MEWDAPSLIRLLDLVPLKGEGGHYSETYRSAEGLTRACLPVRYPGGRSLSTAIYYLLSGDEVSRLHGLASDEVFHFYLGDPVEMLHLLPDGTGSVSVMGPDLASGQRPQILVPRGVWQGCRLAPGGRFALMGCTVAPGFDFADYRQGIRDELVATYPAFRDWIIQLTP